MCKYIYRAANKSAQFLQHFIKDRHEILCSVQNNAGLVGMGNHSHQYCIAASSCYLLRIGTTILYRQHSGSSFNMEIHRELHPFNKDEK